MKRLLFLLLLVMIAFSSNAQSEAFVGMDYRKADMDLVFRDGTTYDAAPSLLTAEFGYMFMPYFGIAGNFGYGISDDNIVVANGVTLSGEIDTLYSAKVIGQYSSCGWPCGPFG